ncbi:putative ribonuclease H-like domain-containing protein [Tanacetum coccineum]
MAHSNSGSNTEVTSCSKEYEESYAKLMKLYDEQKEQLGVASIEIQAYTQALKKVEAQLVCHQQNQLIYEEKIRFMKIDLDDKTNVLIYHKKLLVEAVNEKEELKSKLEKFQSSSKGLSKLLNSQMSTRDKSRLGYGNQIHEGILSYEKEVIESVFDSRSSDVEDSHVNDRFAKVEGMHVVPPPMTGIYMPSKSDFGIDESNVETPDSVLKPAVNKPTTVSKSKVWSDAPIIEEYESDSDDEYVIEPLKEQENPSFAFVNTVKRVKTPRETVKEQNTYSPSPKANKRDWDGLMSKKLGLGYGFTKKACFVCGSFRIKKEYSNARTPQQNGVAERKNMTLIEAARTMLADSFLPNTFWAEAVSTTCYVLNIVLVTKPQNKTPYELITGKGPNWLFDLDYLTDSMNYQVVTAENKANKTAGLKEANHSVVKSSEAKNGDEKPNGDTGPKIHEEQKDQEDQAFLEELERLKRQEKEANDVAKAFSKDTPISTASPSNFFSAGGPDLNNNDQDDSQIPALEDIYDNSSDGIFTNVSYDDEGAAADFTTLETTVNVSLIPTSRIHSIHPTNQILGDPTSAVQTRSKVHKSSEAHAFVSYIQKQRRNNHKDFQHCLFACFLSQIELKKISQALEDESWVDAMQEKLLQFKIQKVWIMVYLPFRKRQEEGIDYDKVFAPVARIEAIKIFLAFASYIGFIFPNKVYKVVKALYGLHQAPRAWYATLSTFLLKSGYRRGTIEKTLFIKKDKNDIMLDKYVAEILKKFDFASMKIASTPIETQKPLTKEEEAADVDVHLYRSMIGSLMYLTASRPDIMFAVYACSKFQVNLKTSHLHAVKRIFRYLKDKTKLGIWYPRVSSFDLEAYSDSDYAGANLDRKSTTGSCQFLSRRLISWQCKKQTIMATSTIEAEYVAAANYCGQVLWIQNQMLDYGFNFMNTKIYIDNESIVKNPVFHSKTKHIEIRHHFIRDAYEKKLIQVLKIHTDDNVADLLTKDFDVSRFNFLIVNIGMLNL